MNHYIGVDLGTSSLKAVLIDENEKIINTVSFSYGLQHPYNNYSEQNPEDWLDAVVKAIKYLSEGIENDIYGLSIAGQMHGLVVLDENDNVLRPCILWNDNRSAEETEYLNNEIGKEKLTEYTGNIAFAGFTAPKILWMQKNEPNLWAKVKKIMLPKDYLVYKLTGSFVSDYSDASGTLLLDVKNKKWSDEMLRICQVNISQLPKLHESYDYVGKILEKYNLPNCKVAAGAGDNAGAAISTNTINEGSCNISLGTSGTIFIASDVFKEDKTNALHSFAHSTGKFHLMACILSAASARKWFLEDILNSSDYSKNDFDIKNIETNVIFLPYLNGERSPHNDPDAKGAFFNITASTSKYEMSLAVLEGVAFALKDCLEVAKKDGVNITKSTICGGGSHSDRWCQIIANCLEIQIDRLEENIGPSFGAAILAMGKYSANNKAKIEKTFLPNYDDELARKYNFFKKYYQLIKSI